MYRELNDYELLYMVCDSNENDFNILLVKYKPLIYKLVKDYIKVFKKFGYDLEDLMQIGYITLYKASRLYDIYNNSMFYTYFKNALEKNIISVIRNNNSNKKQVLNNALSYDNYLNDSNISFIDLISDTNDTNDFSYEITTFKNSMPINLSWIFELYYNGYSKEEISVLLDEKLEIIRSCFSKIKEHALTYKYLFFT